MGKSEMTDTPDTIPLNEQRETTSLWSFPFVRCIHSDYIT